VIEAGSEVDMEVDNVGYKKGDKTVGWLYLMQ
jgi:hypothetical protein